MCIWTIPVWLTPNHFNYHHFPPHKSLFLSLFAGQKRGVIPPSPSHFLFSLIYNTTGFQTEYFLSLLTTCQLMLTIFLCTRTAIWGDKSKDGEDEKDRVEFWIMMKSKICIREKTNLRDYRLWWGFDFLHLVFLLIYIS